MSIEIRACRPDEFGRFYRTVSSAFGEEARDDDVQRQGRLLPTERALVAFEEEVPVGTTGTFPFTLTVPGGQIAAGGVTMVGVLPSHRRRGLLRSLMTEQLHDSRQHGEAVTVLFASEAPIYQRFGYGPATKGAEMDVERERASFRSPRPAVGRTRLLTHDEALDVLPDAYERTRVKTPGMFARSREWWEAHTLVDAEHHRDGGGPMFRVAWEHDGRAEAYALYRVHGEWADGVPVGWLEVIEAVASSPDAVREIWRFLFGVDLVARIRAFFEPADHPLFLMCDDPRRLRLRLKDALWLRIVDLEAALAGRAYPSDGTLVLEVSDRLCPWNEGRWRMEVRDGRARVTRTDEAAHIELATEDLATLYLGGFTMGELRRADRARELQGGAVARATALFASERPPWCPEVF
jgi:predicted acetyltransferase